MSPAQGLVLPTGPGPWQQFARGGGLACDRWDWDAWDAGMCPVSSVLHLPRGSRQPLYPG